MSLSEYDLLAKKTFNHTKPWTKRKALPNRLTLLTNRRKPSRSPRSGMSMLRKRQLLICWQHRCHLMSHHLACPFCLVFALVPFAEALCIAEADSGVKLVSMHT